MFEFVINDDIWRKSQNGIPKPTRNHKLCTNSTGNLFIYIKERSDLFYLSSINGEKEAKSEYYFSVKDCQVYLGNREVKKYVRWVGTPSAFKYLLGLGEAHDGHGESVWDSPG